MLPDVIKSPVPAAPETCQTCIFYQGDGDDIGTCTISENIVEPSQEACNDQISNND